MSEPGPVVPGAGAPGTGAPAEGQTAVAPVTTTPQAPQGPAIGELIEQVRRELKAEFDAKLRSMQSKSDRAYAAALRDAKVVDTVAAELQLPPEQAARAKKAVTDKVFDATFAEPEPQPGVTGGRPPDEKVWTRDELQAFAKQQYGLEPAEFDVSQWAGLGQSDPRGLAYHDAARKASQAKATAQAVAQTKQGFGGTTSPVVAGAGGSQAVSAESLTKQMQDILDLPPTGDHVERKRRGKLLAELDAKLEQYEASTRVPLSEQQMKEAQHRLEAELMK